MEPTSAIAAVSSIAQLIEFSGIVLSKGYDYLIKVAHAPKELRLILTETALLNSLLDQLQLLVEDDTGAGKGAVLKLQQAGAITESQELLVLVNDSVAACQQIEGQSTRNFGKRLLWPFKEKETKRLLQRFHVVREIFTSAISVDVASALKRIEPSVKKIEDDLASIHIRKDRRRAEEEHARLIIYLAYDTVYPEENYEAALSYRHPGTSSWFLKEPSFTGWLSSPNGMMWVYGIPGSGKTVLSSTIIEYLRGNICPGIGLVYYYSDHQDPKKRNFRNFVGSGISQLLAQAPQCMEDIKEFHARKKGEVGGKPSTWECLQLLKSFTLRFRKVYIILDALDESNELEAFIIGLNELRSSAAAKTTAQILITSRQEVQIERQMKQHLSHLLCLTANIEQDIRTFITEQVQLRSARGQLKFRNPDLPSQIVAALCAGADGMFLWAKIQLDRICRLRTDRDIRKALNTLPRDLEETYIHILEQIEAKNPEAVEDIKRVFQWLIGGFCPLPLAVITEAISVHPGDVAFDEDMIANDLEDLVVMCGSLVTVDKSTGHCCISFVHFSIEEFLRSKRIKQSSVAIFYMDPPAVHAELAKACVRYLWLSDFEISCATRSEFNVRNEKYRFLKYASQNWIGHLNESGMTPEAFQEEVLPRLEWFLNATAESSHFSSWAQGFICLMPELHAEFGRMQRISRQSAIFYALLYGTDLVLDITFLEGDEIHDRFWDDMTPLHVTAYAGHHASTKRLLEAGATIEAKTAWKSLTPLHLAAEKGHASIVKILLDSGADPHARSHSGSTPLYRSTRGGSLEVLDMLRAQGWDTNVRTWDDHTPLFEAVEADQVAFVERLMDWGGDPHVMTKKGYSPFSLAMELHRMDIVEVFNKRRPRTSINNSLEEQSQIPNSHHRDIEVIHGSSGLPDSNVENDAT